MTPVEDSTRIVEEAGVVVFSTVSVVDAEVSIVPVLVEGKTVEAVDNTEVVVLSVVSVVVSLMVEVTVLGVVVVVVVDVVGIVVLSVVSAVGNLKLPSGNIFVGM